LFLKEKKEMNLDRLRKLTEELEDMSQCISSEEKEGDKNEKK
jgi:hypothetical protein